MKALKLVSDEELVQLFRSGNEMAFSTLLYRHKNLIFSHIYSYLKDEDLSNDIFQETFIKIINCIKLDTYNESGKFKYWAMRIARNLVIDYIRSSKTQNTISNTDTFDVFNNQSICEDNIEDCMISIQTNKQVQLLIELLPENQKEIIYMRFYQDLSFKEISDLTGVSINTSLGRMRYALMNIRKIAQEKNIVLV